MSYLKRSNRFIASPFKVKANHNTLFKLGYHSSSAYLVTGQCLPWCTVKDSVNNSMKGIHSTKLIVSQDQESAPKDILG